MVCNQALGNIQVRVLNELQYRGASTRLSSDIHISGISYGDEWYNVMKRWVEIEGEDVDPFAIAIFAPPQRILHSALDPMDAHR